MRKRFRQKLRSCAICEPHKAGWNHRWTSAETARLQDDERQIFEATHQRTMPASDLLQTRQNLAKGGQKKMERRFTAVDLDRFKARRLSGELKAADARKRRRPPARGGPATVNRELSFLRRVFNVAIEDGLAQTNPVKSKIFTKENNARVRYLTEEEAA
jgi:hypothetical protein